MLGTYFGRFAHSCLELTVIASGCETWLVGNDNSTLYCVTGETVLVTHRAVCAS